jgi:hypothetical protein
MTFTILKPSKKSILALFLITILFSITSCDNEAIFSAIESEVELDDDPSVVGNVYSMAFIGTGTVDDAEGYLYVANGNIYYKDVTAGRGWTKFTEPEDGEYTSRVASDATYLYAFVQYYDEDDDDDDNSVGSVYYCEPDGSSSATWTLVSDSAYAVFDNSETGTDTDTGSTTRNAYITLYDDDTDEYEVYLLDPTETDYYDTTSLASDDDIIVAAASNNDTDDPIDYFSTHISFCSYDGYFFRAAMNDADDSDDAYKVYYVTESDFTDASTQIDTDLSWTKTWTTDDDDDISRMFVGLDDDDSPVLYIATDDGIEECDIDGYDLDDIDLSDQCETTIGDYKIYGIWRYGTGTYASSVETSGSDDNELWGTYDDTDWDCE